MQSQIWPPLRLILLLLLAIAGGGCNGNGDTLITGGGSSFVNPIMQKWSDVFHGQTAVKIDYKKSGSTNGIKEMTSRTVDFGCTDVPMSKDETELAKSQGGEVIHVPVAMGAVAIVYNVPGIDQQLILDGKTIADIYNLRVTSWDDPAIAALNPELKGKLPKQQIVTVYRAESSGTSKIFTEFLSKSSSEFKNEIGASSQPKWKKGGTGQNGNDGIAGFVKENAGTIGYVELYFAKKGEISFAKVRNRQKKPISPEDEAGVAAAALTALETKPDTEPYNLHELTFSATDVDGEGAYPICGITYAVLYAKQPQKKGRKLVEFLKWAASEGQKYAPELNYAPLPAALTQKVQARLDQVTFE